MRQYYVYILRCADGTFYTGVTNDVQRRFTEHAGGMNEDCYTFGRRPVELVYVEVFQYIYDAICRETVLKKWGYRKKEALIKGNKQQLCLLSKKKFPVCHKKQCASVRRFNVLMARFLVRSRLRRELLGMTEGT